MSELKKVFKIAFPATIAILGHIGYNIVDNIMIAKFLGSSAIAISGVGAALYYIFLMFAIGSTGIVTALISEATAKKSEKEVTKVFQNSVLFCMMLGIIVFIIMLVFSHPLISTVNRQAHLTSQITTYFRILCFGILPVMLFFALDRLCEGMGNTKPAMYATVFCNVANIFLNYGLLTGSFGLPNMGIMGPAISTLFNSFLEAVVLLFLMLRNENFRKIIKAKFQFISLPKIKEIARLGIPGGFLVFFESLTFNTASFIASKVSVFDVAAHQLILWLINGALVPLFGLSVGLTSRIAYKIEAGEKKEAYKMSLIGIFWSGVYIVSLMSLFYLFGSTILNTMFKGGAEDYITIGLILGVLPALILIELFDGLQIVTAAILRGYKDTKLPSIFGLISYLGVGIPVGFTLGVIFNLGVYGIWVGLGFGVFTQSILLISRLLLKYRVKELNPILPPPSIKY